MLSDADYPTWAGAVHGCQNPGEDCLYKYAIWDAARRPRPRHGRRREPRDSRHRRRRRPCACSTTRTTARPKRVARGRRGPARVCPARRSGLGVGEFVDLKLLTDWAVQTGLQLVQVLPINDTTATHTWVDSYPYAAISVFALHPQFLHLEGIAPLKTAKPPRSWPACKQELNAKDFVDYEPVMAAKWKFLQAAVPAGEKAASWPTPTTGSSWPSRATG
ncbi:MAG: 4-alpha-glucanotransferase [Hymenobacter sp.]